MEAFVDLRGRLLDTDRKMKQLSMQEAALAQEKRRAELTLQELEALPSDTRAYQGVALLVCSAVRVFRCAYAGPPFDADLRTRMTTGKAFVLEPLDDLKNNQKAVVKKCEDAQESLEASKKYLEKQMQEVQQNFKELMQQVPGLAQQLMQMTPPSA